MRSTPPFAYVVLLLIAFYVVFNEQTRNLGLLGIGTVLFLWSLWQILVHRLRGFLFVTALCAGLAGVAYLVLGSVPSELIGLWLAFLGLWSLREIAVLLWHLMVLAAQRWRAWRARPRRASARRETKLEPVTVSVPAPRSQRQRPGDHQAPRPCQRTSSPGKSLTRNPDARCLLPYRAFGQATASPRSTPVDQGPYRRR